MTDVQSRRMFLRAAAAAGAAWAAADLTQIEEALAWSAQQATRRGRRGARFAALTEAQAATLESMTARILPAVDGRPGAREAGAIHFIDRSLATFNAPQKPLYADGVADLDRRAAAGRQAIAVTAPAANTAAHPTSGGKTFAALPPAQQDALLRDIEQTPFFQAVRFDAIVGTFALPTWGGNRNYAGWRLLGIEHLPAFQAPFGFYDTEANRKG